MSSTIRDVIRTHAERTPDRTAVIFLEYRGPQERASCLTCAALDRRARAIAAHLHARLRPGDRALVVHTPGLAAVEAILGCFYAGVVAIPLPASRSERASLRTAMVLRDSDARALLCTQAQAARSARGLEGSPGSIATDAIPDADADAFRAVPIAADRLAYLQYTSGSAGAPKGVMISHAALMSNLAQIREAFDHDAGCVVVSWLPFHHDMGLVGTLLQPLYVGFLAVLMSPLSFVQRPERWLRAIARYGGTSCGGPNFAYQLCVERVPGEVRRTLDLRTWRVAFCGAEPIHAATVRRFTEAYAPCGFRAASFFPCYGLAEATLFVTSARVDTPPVIRAFEASALERDEVTVAGESGRHARELVGCGDARGATEVVIADAQGRPLPSGRVGEICVRGPSLGSGYWQRPDDSRTTFASTLADAPDVPCLRTGDSGFRHDGQLFVAGRLKDLIIVDGRNIASHDLEWTAETSDGRVREAAAFAVATRGSERPVVLVGVDDTFAAPTVREIGDRVRRAIGDEHDLGLAALAVVRTSALARTTSGKLARAACQRAYQQGALDVLATWSAGAGWSDDDGDTRAGIAARWLVGTRRPAARLRLFCFGHAGARAEPFTAWSLRLPPEIDVCPVQLPGHGNRASEPACRRLDPLLLALQDLVSAHTDAPYALFGHCIGGRIAFELTCHLHRAGLPAPVHLFLAAVSELGLLPAVDRDSYRLSPPELEAHIARYGGLPASLRARSASLQRVLDLVRADLELTGTMTRRPPVMLPCPISVFGGREDPTITDDQLLAWRAHTSADFAFYWIRGGHFFLEDQAELLLSHIAGRLLPAGQPIPERAEVASGPR